MPLPVAAGREIVDETHVPVGVGRNPGIAATAIVVDSGDHAVIAVLETRVDGVDLRRRNQRFVEKIGALVGSKAGRLLPPLPPDACPADRLNKILDISTASSRVRSTKRRDRSVRLCMRSS